MKTVYKYKLLDPAIGAVDRGLLHMHPGPILKVDSQNDNVCIWALVDTKKPAVPRQFILVGTGFEVPSGVEYIGTAQLYGGALVLHVFEEPEGR